MRTDSRETEPGNTELPSVLSSDSREAEPVNTVLPSVLSSDSREAESITTDLPSVPSLNSKEVEPVNTEIPSVLAVTPESLPLEPSPPTVRPESAVTPISPAKLSTGGQTEKVVETTAIVFSDSDSEDEQEQDLGLPTSRGQLRLVPYASLMSPSFVPPPDDDKDDPISSAQEPIRTSTINNATTTMGPMVAIPKNALSEMELDSRSSTPATPAVSLGNLYLFLC